MKQKYNVKGLSCVEESRGEIINIQITLNIPKGLNNYKKDQYPAENSIDFRDFTDDIDMVLDWEVVDKHNIIQYNKDIKIINNKTIISILKKSGANLTDQKIIDLKAVYFELYESIKHLNIMDQIKILLNSVNIGLLAKIDAYKNMTDILKSDVEIEMIGNNIRKYKIISNARKHNKKD